MAGPSRKETAHRVTHGRLRQPRVQAAEVSGDLLAAKIAHLYADSIPDTNLTYDERLDRFWNGIKDEPDDLAVGVAALIRNLPFQETNNETPQRETTRRLLREILGKRIPSFFTTLSRENLFEYHMSLFPVIMFTLSQEQYEIPKTARTYLTPLLANWQEDRRLTLLTEGFIMQSTSGAGFYQSFSTTIARRKGTRELQTNGWEHSGIADKFSKEDFLIEQAKMHQMYIRIVNEFSRNRLAGVFNGKMFRLAVIMLDATSSLVIGKFADGTEKKIRDIGLSYIVDFVNHFRKRENGHREAVKTIADILPSSPPVIKRIIAGFFVDDAVSFHDPQFGFEITASLTPLLHRLIEEIAEHPSGDSQKVLYSLLQATTYMTRVSDRQEVVDNMLLGRIKYSQKFTDRERAILGRNYILSFAPIGFAIDLGEALEDVFLKIANGMHSLMLFEDIKDGEPLYIPATGQVIGYLRSLRPQYEPEAAAQPLSPMMPEEPAELEAADRTNRMLDDIFGPVPSNEKVPNLRSERGSKWRDIFGPDAKRGDSSFTRRGHIFQPTLSLIRKANEGALPRVELYKQAVHTIDGVSASDISAKLVGEAGEIRLFLDRFGEVGGPIADFYLEGYISENRIEQLNHFLICLCHKLLVEEPGREFAKRARQAREFAEAQLEPNNDQRKRQLESAQLLGRKTAVIELSYGGEGLEPTITEVAEERIVERLEKGENFVPVHFFLPEDERKKTKRSKGRVLDGDEGRLVFLPAKPTKKGELPQASDAAREHAKRLFARVPDFVQVFWLTPSGLLAKTEPLTMTFASYPNHSNNQA